MHEQLQGKHCQFMCSQHHIRINAISIITHVILEIRALPLAENGIIFRYNHLRRGA